MDAIIEEFLAESREDLDQLERDLVIWEKEPGSPMALASIFRTVHTLKGTAGFLSFDKLEKIAHATENLLSLLRDGKLVMRAEIAGALLAISDTIRAILAHIESSGTEGPTDETTVLERLAGLHADRAAPAPLTAALQSETPSGETAPLKPDSTVRVSVALLDRLMNMVGELVLTRNQIGQSAAKLENAEFAGAAQRLNLITSELQESVMKTRMEPIGDVWNKFPRLVRDLEQVCGKRVRMVIDGAHTELDRTLLEAIRDPLTHLVRNAIDHGLELPEGRLAAGKKPDGCLSLRAYHEGGLVNIEISDDGAGIDTERVKQNAVARGLIAADHAARMNEREAIDLIFLPGFSTAEKVSSISGRGVGMDVVKTHIERIGGVVDVVTKLGRGTTFKIKIPLTLAIIPALTVSCGGDRYAIPQVNVTELLRVQRAGGIEYVHGALVHRLRGSLLPLVHLGRELQVESQPSEEEIVLIVVVRAGERRFGLIVEDVHDAAEIVVKPLARQFKGISCFAGAAIMGNGRVALILDVFGLAQRANVIGESSPQVRAAVRSEAPHDDAQSVLILDLAGARSALPLSAISRLEEFPRATIESSGARRAVQYRGEILPLVGVGNVPLNMDSVQAIVCSQGGRNVGFVVSKIHDIVTEPFKIQRHARRPGVLGSAVIGHRVTDVLDPSTIIEAGDPVLAEEVHP